MSTAPRCMVALSVCLLTATVTSCSLLGNGEFCAPQTSVVRTWNEAALDAVRRDFPAPTVHARNLYHLAAVSWDSWAAYDPEATGLFNDLKVDSTEG